MKQTVKSFRMSLQSKLVISFAAILLIPCLTLGWFAYETSKDKAEQQIMDATPLSNYFTFNYVRKKITRHIRFEIKDTLQSLLLFNTQSTG